MYPKLSCRGQKRSRPVRHNSQTPQVEARNVTPARSPHDEAGDAGAQRLHAADAFVPQGERHARQFLQRGHKQVGMAQAAGLHLDEHFAGARFGDRDGGYRNGSRAAR